MPSGEPVKREDVEGLFRVCRLKAGCPFPESDVGEFGTEFMRAPRSERGKILDLLIKAAQENATKEDAWNNVDLALLTLANAPAPWTLESLAQVSNPDEAQAALNDIADDFATISNEKVLKEAIAAKLAAAELDPDHAAAFLRHTDGVTLGYRATIVRQVIRELFKAASPPPPSIAPASSEEISEFANPPPPRTVREIVNKFAMHGTIEREDFDHLVNTALKDVKDPHSALTSDDRFEKLMQGSSRDRLSVTRYLRTAIENPKSKGYMTDQAGRILKVLQRR